MIHHVHPDLIILHNQLQVVRPRHAHLTAVGRLSGIKKFFGMSARKERYTSQCSADEKRSDPPCSHFNFSSNLQLWFKGKSSGDDDSLNSKQRKICTGDASKELVFAAIPGFLSKR